MCCQPLALRQHADPPITNPELHRRGTGCYPLRRQGVKKLHPKGRLQRMITETTTLLSPERVLQEARRFFTEENSIAQSAIVEESERHLTVATFRSRLAITAWPDQADARTRVRVSTLRRQDVVGKFLTWIETAGETE